MDKSKEFLDKTIKLNNSKNSNQYRKIIDLIFPLKN